MKPGSPLPVKSDLSHPSPLDVYRTGHDADSDVSLPPALSQGWFQSAFVLMKESLREGKAKSYTNIILLYICCVLLFFRYIWNYSRAAFFCDDVSSDSQGII